MTKTIYTQEHRTLCALLIEARNKAGLTQEELGARLKKHQPYVARYEAGQKRIDVVELLRIAAALGVSASKIVRQLERQ